jgi:pyruvate-ferredoxin/flavodoxin oxidoreductase
MKRPKVTIDGNEAAAFIAHKTNEVIAIYPITPSSPMGEWADQWSSEGKTNIWGMTPQVVEMQSEAGAAGALHGALQGGCLATTFTSSQGLLLMIPNMYKIAGELSPAVIHVAARSLAAQALSIFGDHQDVMAVRQTGWAMLASNCVQEVMDFALIAQAATLESRIPVVHFLDGFRTSHEIAKVEQLSDDDIRSMISVQRVREHRERALSPDHPFIRGTAQNPDVYFQAREAANPYYLAVPLIMQDTMDRFAQLTGRQYRLFDYVGAPDARHVIVAMGSGAEVVQEAIETLNRTGSKTGLVKVRLYRPFLADEFAKALPPTVEAIAVLDRTKEPGSVGEPLYTDVVTALAEVRAKSRNHPVPPKVIGGRYGLSSKEFTPAMVRGVFAELEKEHSKNHFTVGICDDVTHTSIDYNPTFSTEAPGTTRALFYGLGADGTVGANKNSIKIIGEETDLYAQGYFVYDSKKSGSGTISHLRFGPRPIHSSYLITQASFVACHQFAFLERINVLKHAEPDATFLLNSPFGPDEVWDHLPCSIQQEIVNKRLRFYVIDAYKVARETGMGSRINTVMQTCFFAISNVLPRQEAIAAIKKAIAKTYGKRGDAVVQQNFAAVDQTLDNLFPVATAPAAGVADFRPPVPAEAPSFVRDVLGPMIQGEGDALAVSKLPADGTYPSGTSKWEKRNIAQEIPAWDTELCIQCGKCVLVCPHAAIRAKMYDADKLAGAPASFLSAPARWKGLGHMRYTLQVAPEDCTGCTLCVEVCPAKSKADPNHRAVDMVPQTPIRTREAANWQFFLGLPEYGRDKLSLSQVKDVQLLQPLFEFSGACSGCGETPYIKLMSQLFGDRTIVANATGCSSIYGGNLPTTPYTLNKDGRGIAWSNSLFEDNAEFGLGIRLAQDKQTEYARALLRQLAPMVGEDLACAILDAGQSADQRKDTGIREQRERVAELKSRLTTIAGPQSRELAIMADSLVKRVIWIVGGDGWAYDIGYGGVDHVLASGENVNLLVLDTEVYSNTGGQRSKSTPRGAVAKFAAGGKKTAKKDLALMAMINGNVYVARVAIGANDSQTLRAFLEAESYHGPSLIIGYGPCIAHGIEMSHNLQQQKLAVKSGHWPLFRYDPRRLAEGKNPMQLDSQPPSIPLEQYLYSEGRFAMLAQSHPEAAKELLEEARRDVRDRWRLYEAFSHMANAGASVPADVPAPEEVAKVGSPAT